MTKKLKYNVLLIFLPSQQRSPQQRSNPHTQSHPITSSAEWNLSNEAREFLRSNELNTQVLGPTHQSVDNRLGSSALGEAPTLLLLAVGNQGVGSNCVWLG